jgi:Zn-dependent protease with chaperone function
VSYGLRLAVVALAAFSVTSLAVSLVVPAIWRRVPQGAPATRADLFFLVRLLPTLFGALAAAVIVLSFLSFEPAVHGERVGLVLTGLAALGAASLAGSCVQLTRQWLLTQRVVRGWLRTASAEVARPAHPSPDTPIDVVDIAFPIVALVGLLRPRLIVARKVIDACPPDEWRAIVAHEEGHRLRRDNLRRALVTAAPDLLSRLRIGSRLANDWHQVTEEAADEQAALLGERGRVDPCAGADSRGASRSRGGRRAESAGQRVVSR